MMQNFSNFLNQIENKRLCHGFNNMNNESIVGSTTNHNNNVNGNVNGGNANNKQDFHAHASDNNINSTYANSSSNLTNTNG